MTDPTADLQFEHATYDKASTDVVCGMCGRPVGSEYWQWMGRVACESCKRSVAALHAQSSSPATFATAAGLGLVTAIVCGALYRGLVVISHVDFGLVAIGVAYAIASVIRKVTKNVSGRQYQVLAVALTYFACSMHYVPLESLPFAALSTSAAVHLVGYMLTVPFVSITDAPIGFVILAIGLYSAWQRTRGLPMVVAGPFRVAPLREAAAP